jgi:hypothetical protein
MVDFQKQLTEVLNKIESLREKIIFLEKLLKEIKEPEQRDVVKKLLAQLEKEAENKKKENMARMRRASGIEQLVVSDADRKAPVFLTEELPKIPSIERELQFAEEPGAKKSTLDKGYVEKSSGENAYNPKTEKKVPEAYRPETNISAFKPIEEREFKTETYHPREKSTEEALEGYSPRDEIRAESLKEEYKRKKRI